MKNSFELPGRTETEVKFLFEYFYKGNQDFVSSTSTANALAKIANSRGLEEREVIQELPRLELSEFKGLESLEYFEFRLGLLGYDNPELPVLLEVFKFNFFHATSGAYIRNKAWRDTINYDFGIDFAGLSSSAKTDWSLFLNSVDAAVKKIATGRKELAQEKYEREINRNKFVDFLHKESEARFGLNLSEMILLAINQPSSFNIAGDGLIVDYLYQINSISEDLFLKRVNEAKILRDSEFYESHLISDAALISAKLRYLVFDFDSIKTPNQAFTLLCRYGDSKTWDSIRPNGPDNTEVRLEEIPKLIIEPRIFDQVLRELESSPRARDAFAEFSKTAGDPWDRALKY